MKMTWKTTPTAAEKIWLWQFCCSQQLNLSAIPKIENSTVRKCQASGHRQLQAVNSFRSYYKLLTALTAVTSCRQLWQVLQAVTSIDNCYTLLPALTAVKGCCQLWQLIKDVVRFDICYKQFFISCCQLWQLLQAVASFGSCQRRLPAMTAVKSCC